MIVGIGVDEADLARFERLLAHDAARVFRRVCTDAERAWCESQERPHAALATRWCAKEAVAKSLGTGFSEGVTPRSIEVVRAHDGSVSVALHGAAADVARARAIDRIHLSMSRSEHRALAFAVAERAQNPR